MSEDDKVVQRRFEAKSNEFVALRAEIVSTSSAQSALVGVGLTAVGVLLGFIFRDETNARLAYVVPFICFAVSLLHASYEMKVFRLGAYLRDSLWPSIRSDVGEIPFWEAGRPTPKRGRWIILLFDWTVAGLFTVASGLSVIVIWGAVPLLDALGSVLTIFTALTPELARFIYRELRQQHSRVL